MTNKEKRNFWYCGFLTKEGLQDIVDFSKAYNKRRPETLTQFCKRINNKQLG